jgi:general secretion pathway protein H
MPISRADAEAGFTLVELLAVLAILVIAAAAVLRLGQGSSETAKVRAFLIHAEAMMRDARTAAIASVTPQDVVIDTKARQLVAAGRGASLDVPAGVSLDGKLARVPEAGKGRYVIRFFPHGGSTGASLPFLYRGTVYELRVNWLTGHADVRRS